MQHTPGPWVQLSKLGVVEILSVDQSWIASTTPNNANIMSASPDLLSALQLAVKYLEHPDIQTIPFALSASVAVDRANAAIAKATGAGDK